MSETTAIETTSEKPGTRFMRLTMDAATRMLDQWVGAERAAEAKGRIASAFQAAAMAAKKPDDFYAATPASVAQCVAVAALTGIMPSTGAVALAYLVPRRPRKGEPPQLQYQLSHRGIAALARRAGLTVVAVPCGHGDALEVEDGEVSRFAPDIDAPPMAWDELRGIVVVIKDARTGAPLFRGWVARKIIEARRAASDSYRYAESGQDWAKKSDPWHAWPVEMSCKAALHYAVSRGWAVIDDTEAVRALSIDVQGDLVQSEPVAIGQHATGDAALGLPAPVDVPELLDPEPAYTREPGDDSDDGGTP